VRAAGESVERDPFGSSDARSRSQRSSSRNKSINNNTQVEVIRIVTESVSKQKFGKTYQS
uniref:Uncharacterized protein n=1 Tax=Anopheles dirus TaxID=7168 RepID=A0A182NYN1_9DIPT